MMWGSNVPVTRTPDAHWMAEVRYRGTKVVTVSPDYADNTKFADEWLPAQAGTDAALAMAMGHVILKEFFVDRRVPFFVDYVSTYTDLPFLVTPRRARRATAGWCPASSSPRPISTAGERRRESRVEDRAAGRRHRPAGGAERLDGLPLRRVRRGQVEPRPRGRRAGAHRCATSKVGAETAEVLLPCFEAPDGTGDGAAPRRPGDAGRRAPGHHRLRPDAGPVRRGPRRACPGEWPTGYDDADHARTPRPGRRRSPASRPRPCIRIAREFATQRRGVRAAAR